MSALIVVVPKEHRVRSGCPTGKLQVHSVWQMPDDRIGIWVGAVGATGQRWPITNVTREQVLSWQPKGGAA